MKKLLVAPFLLAASLFMAGNSYAQAPQIIAGGSSGAFTSIVAAMVLPDATLGYTSPICGSNVWTYSSASLVYAVDPRSGSIPTEPGSIAVVWDNSTSPNTVCVYMSIDSIVGLRLFYAQSGSGGSSGNGYIHLDPSVSGSGSVAGLAGQNKVGYITDTVNNTCGPSGTSPCGLPPAVYALVNGAHFNSIFSDIRPDDGEYAYGRAACAPADEQGCFGYGPLGGIGTAILSAFNTNNVANVIAFNVSGGVDQISGLTVPATKTINVGAYPMMFFYNDLDTTAGKGLGALLPTNALSHVIEGFLSGTLGLNQDLVGTAVGTPAAVDVVFREPVSGTYNTTEFQIVHDRDGNSSFSQETGFTPTSYGTNCYTIPSSPTYVDPGAATSTNCSNPARVPGLYNHRMRGVTGGEVIAAVNGAPASGNQNRLGYAFWSLGSFAPSKAGNTRYLAIDGVDPLYASVGSGTWPSCTGAFNTGGLTCSNPPNFTNVKNGNYRVWNIIRGIRYASYTPPTSGPSVDTLIAAAQDQAYSAAAADFVPYQRCTAGTTSGCTTFAPVLTVFRSHYALPSTVGIASNGIGSEPAENGGDMAGTIFNTINESDAYNIAGSTFITWIQ